MINGKELIGLINMNVKSDAVFNYLQNKESHLVINSPQEEDILTLADNWCNYDFQDLGFIVETIEDIVCSISFRINKSKLYNEKGPIFAGLINGSLELLKDKSEVRSKLGKPNFSCAEFDQFHLNNDLMLGLLYDNSLENLLVMASFGSIEIFMNESLRPNRSSIIFESLKPHL